MVTPTIISLHEKGNNVMTVKEKIDYMILSLQVARDELEYAEKYLNNAKNKYNNEKRTPNVTPVSYTHLDVYKRQILSCNITILIQSPRKVNLYV